jgi:hypothetical protein
MEWTHPLRTESNGGDREEGIVVDEVVEKPEVHGSGFHEISAPGHPTEGAVDRMVSCRLHCMDVGESKRPREQREEHEPADDERNDDSLESMPREDRRPLAGEEHRPEETRHHEEDRHAEDVNG